MQTVEFPTPVRNGIPTQRLKVNDSFWSFYSPKVIGDHILQMIVAQS